MEATFWRLVSLCTEHIMSVNMGMHRQSEWLLCTLSTLHINSNGSHFLTAWVLVYWTYKFSKFGYGETKWMASINSKYNGHISWNKFWWLGYWCTEHIGPVNSGMEGQSILHVLAQMEATFWWLGSWFTEHIRPVNLGMDRQSDYLLCTLSIPHI